MLLTAWNYNYKVPKDLLKNVQTKRGNKNASETFTER